MITKKLKIKPKALRIRNDLKQADSSNRDGMDIAICVINPQKDMVSYAGANNPLYYRIENSELLEIKADKLSIGGFQDEEERKFHRTDIQITTSTTFYLFSDGYADQFGGENGRKMGTKRYKEILDSVSHIPINQQKEQLVVELNRWR